jgi:hypothetical protein
MKDITDVRVIYAKGFLFFLGGLLAAGLLLLEHPNFKVALLLVVAIYCFARFYYFAFYVIRHYVDSDYRFSGLWSFATYVWKRRGQRRNDKEASK